MKQYGQLKRGAAAPRAWRRGAERLITFVTTETTMGRYAREVARKFVEDNCPLIAAAISFFALLSMVPLLLFGVALLGSVLSGARAQEVVLDFVREQLPGAQEQIGRALRNLIEGHEWGGIVGLFGLLWAASQVFLNLEIAMNLAWQVSERRSLFHRRLLSLGMTLLTGVPLILSLLLTAAITTVREIRVPVLGWQLGEIPLVWNLVGDLAPVLLTTLSFTAIYWGVPNCRVHWRAALLGGVVGGLLWEAAKRTFAFYTANLAAFGQIYGPFAGLVGLMLWIFISSLILLAGAEIAAVAQSVHPLFPNPTEGETEERLREADGD